MLPKGWKKVERVISNHILFSYMSPDGRMFNSIKEVREEVNNKNKSNQLTSSAPPPPAAQPASSIPVSLPPPARSAPHIPINSSPLVLPSSEVSLSTSIETSAPSQLIPSSETTKHANIIKEINKWFGLDSIQEGDALSAKEWLDLRIEKTNKYTITGKTALPTTTELTEKKTAREEVLCRNAPGIPKKALEKAGKDLLEQFFTSQGWFKHDGVPTSYIDILCEMKCNNDIFHEIDPDSPCFGAILTHYFSGSAHVRAKTNVCVDRVYKIGADSDSIPNKDMPFGFYSNSNFKKLISYARGNLQPKEQIIFQATCSEALRPIKGYQYCLIVGYSASDVHEGDVPPKKVPKVTYGYYKESRRAAFCATPSSVKPLLLVLFRKVRKSDLWMTTRNNEVLEAPAPIPTIPYPTTDESTYKSTSMFFNKLLEKSNDFCTSKNVEMYMIPKTICVTDKFVCISSRAPREMLDFIIAPRSPLNWDTLSQKNAGEIIGLYAFAHYVRGVIRELKVCMKNMEILFPIDPSQWLVHCHIMSCDANSDKRKQFLSIDEFLERLNSGEIGRESGYRVRAEYDLGYCVPPPKPDSTKTPAEQKADLCDYLLTQNNAFYPQYWHGGSGDEPIVKSSSIPK